MSLLAFSGQGGKGELQAAVGLAHAAAVRYLERALCVVYSMT